MSLTLAVAHLTMAYSASCRMLLAVAVPTSPTKAVVVFCIAGARLEWQGKGHLVFVEAMSPCSASTSCMASAPTSCPGEARRRTAPRRVLLRSPYLPIALQPSRPHDWLLREENTQQPAWSSGLDAEGPLHLLDVRGGARAEAA